MKPHLWLIKFIGVIVPRRLRADWRQEWEAELHYREELLANWDRLDWRNRLDLLRRSVGALWDALLLQPRRLEDDMFQDLRFGLRMLRKNPGFTAIAVMTLSLGIGANTAIFSVVNGVRLKPLPYPEPERLVRVFQSITVLPKAPMSPADFRDYREQNTSFESLAGYFRQDLELALEDRAERLMGMRASSGYFRALGLQPMLGREFTREEEIPDDSAVVILSHGLWLRRFQGDPMIVGKTIRLSGKSFTVVGVAPAGLQHVGGGYRPLPHGESVDIWWPMRLGPNRPRSANSFDVLKLALRRGMALTFAGVGAGLALAFAATRLMANLLYGVGATDPATFVAVPLFLIGVSFVACWIPARRATQVDPLVAIRRE